MMGVAAGPANDWQQLWLLAEAQPASAQRPLLNPHKEGELVSALQCGILGIRRQYETMTGKANVVKAGIVG